MINTSDLNEARKEILRLKKEGGEIVVQSNGPEFDRKILEWGDVDILLGCEMHNRKDFMKQRDSGLNEIMCNLAKKNNIKIGIDIERIKKLEEIPKGKVLARIKQNLLLCKKSRTEIVFWPVKKFNKLDLIGLIKSLRLGSDFTKLIS